MKNLWLIVLLGLATSALAAPKKVTDLRVGDWPGIFGNVKCSYNIQTKEPHFYVFEGRIVRPSLQESDRVRIIQTTDGSLRITRYLQGRNAGKTQVVDTYPPTVRAAAKGTYVQFPFRKVTGISMQGTESNLLMFVPK